MEEGKKIGIGGRKDEDTAAAAAAKLLQSCPTQCDPIDDSPPGSPVPGIIRQEYWSGVPLPSPILSLYVFLVSS